MTDALPQRRDQVLATAERLFAERGFHGTSVRDIADVLNIRGGSLYAHIDSKDDLLWEIVAAAADRFFAAIQPIVESDLITVEKLKRVIAAHVQVITSNLSSAAVYTSEWRSLSDNRKVEFTRRRDEYEQMIRQLVHDCIVEGVFGAVDEKFATLLILSSLNWIYLWYKPDGPMTPDEIARRITDYLFNGLRQGCA